jgi:hypothetical protein
MNNAPSCDTERSDPRGHLVQQLRRQLGHWETDFGEPSRTTSAGNAAFFSSGTAAIDRLLPGGGLRHGMLVEWLGGEWSRGVVEQRSSGGEEQRSRGAEQKTRSYSTTPLPHYSSSSYYSTTPLLHYSSSSAVTLSLLSAREACREGGELVVIDRRQTFYPPAAAAWGIDLARLLVIHPRTARDELWAAVESLRSPAVAAVWAEIERLDNRAFRRLQLAAHAGRTLGLLLRPASVRGQPSWADVRLEVRGELQNANCTTTLRAVPEIVNWRTSAMENLQFAICNLQSPTLFAGRQIQVHVLRLRGGRPGQRAMLEIDDATYTVREVEKGYQLSAIGSRPNLLADSR